MHKPLHGGVQGREGGQQGVLQDARETMLVESCSKAETNVWNQDVGQV